MPTPAEARLLADVRRRVADAVGLSVGCLDTATVRDRYAELLHVRTLR